MLWRGSARLGGVGGVDFNVIGNPAELVRKLEMNADIAVFVNLDMVYQVREDLFRCFDTLQRLPARGVPCQRHSRAPPVPRSPGVTRYSVVEKKKLPLIYHQKSGANGGAIKDFLQIFFHAFQTAQNRLTDRGFVHVLGHIISNLNIFVLGVRYWTGCYIIVISYR